MSLVYLIDGYNLLHASERWADIPRGRQREVFLRDLDEGRSGASERNTVTVVLDGYSVDLEKMRWKNIRVVFSGDRDADTVIKERVGDLSHPRSAIVVTNDNGIRDWVRRVGAKVLSCEEFLALSNRKRKSKPTAAEKLDAQTAGDINAELKQRWKI